jgi:tight adherence protein C
MLVVSVEAGLGLNAALMRVSEEMDRMSPVLSEQLGLVNLEIRAGTSREEALRNLAERTGLQDISSLVGMLIQTDRFGTSVAQALRVHADTMRTKRRQRRRPRRRPRSSWSFPWSSASSRRCSS